MLDKLLIIEDDQTQLKRYESMLRSKCNGVFTASSIETATAILAEEPISVILTDIHLTESERQNSYEGLEIIKLCKEHHPEITVLAMSSDPKIDTFLKIEKLGGSFIKKPIISADEIFIAIESAKYKKNLQRAALQAMDKTPLPFKDGIIIDNELRRMVFAVASSKAVPCVISGETGTGKEEIAKLIHKRRVETEGQVPFVAVNCANLDPNTAVSELFGHKKGSFTGAHSTTIGLIGEANGGILFLDEIHKLSQDIQYRLLRVLNDGSYSRLGDTKTLRSEFQIVVASTKNLDDLVQTDDFLMDLRSRMTGIEIHLKPLRERMEDLEDLVKLYFAKNNKETSPSEIESIVQYCKKYYWQGNIRQLYNMIRTLVLLCEMEGVPMHGDLMPVYQTMLAPTVQSTEPQASKLDSEDIIARASGDFPIAESIKALEMLIIENAISRHPTLGKAAKAISMSRSSFDHKRDKYGLT